jgi:hypothetical protein
MAVPLVILCGDHSYAPWAIVCIHLINDPSNQWCKIEVVDGREVDGDWVCPDCYDKHQAGDDPVDQLVPLCMHCVNHLKQQHG